MNVKRHTTAMKVAHAFAERSTCDRAHVGAVIMVQGRIIATGYNGAPAGMPHCDHTCTCVFSADPAFDVARVGHHPTCPQAKPCGVAVHAEANAIAFAAKYGVSTDGAELLTTMAPCYNCSQLIINAGISAVHFDQPYRIRDGLELLEAADVRVFNFRWSRKA